MAHLDRKITRRTYLGLTLGWATASLLAACGQSQPSGTSQSGAAAKPTTAPTQAAAKPTEAASPAAAAKPNAAASPAASPAAQAAASPVASAASPAASPAAQANAPTPVAAANIPMKGPGAGFDWKQFSGQSLNVLFVKHPWSTAAEEALPKFTDMTGIKVTFEDLPELQARQKLAVDFAGGGGTYDAFNTSMHVEKIQFWKSGWYQPLNEMLSDPKLLSPEFDWTDTVDSAKQAVTAPDGKVLALPTFTDVSVMAYRQDLFDEKGLKPPASLDDLVTAIKTVHNPSGGVYGWASRGLKNANMTQWPCEFFNYGGHYFTPDGKSDLGSEATVQSVDWYATMDREYGPPGVVNFNWYEVTAGFMQGQIAAMQDGINFFSQYEDPSKSRVVGKVHYMLVPKGPGGLIPPTYTSGVAVSSKSKKQGPAFLLAQFLTGQDQGIRSQLAGIGVARLSTWNDPKVKEAQKMPKDWVDTYLEGMKLGKPGLPEIAAVTQYRDDVGALIQQAIEGGDVKQIVKQMDQAFQAILDKEPK